MFRKIKNNKGVTMIELLGAITILAILLGVAVPAISETIRKTRNQTYVDAAMKLISNAEYQFRKDNKLPKPTSSRCILMSLVYLNNGAFEEAPNGGDYTRNQSFVVAIKDPTKNEHIYYVRLMEDMGDGEYRGINFNTRSELVMDNAFNKVVNINGSDLFKVNEASNAEILAKIKAKIPACSSVHVYAPDAND